MAFSKGKQRVIKRMGHTGPVVEVEFDQNLSFARLTETV
jgi:hypothetical protein